MKRLIGIALIITVIISCKKALTENPLGQVAGNEVLSTTGGLQAALVGAYRPMGITFVTGYTSAAIVAVLMGSDDLTTDPGSNKQDLREFDQFNVDPTNDRMAIIWAGCYKSIQGANNIIANYKSTQGDAATINQIVGEAYYLRAFNYYWLVRLWGNIPLITTANFTAASLKVTKSAPADVYALIESDLTTATGLMANLPVTSGRASKGSALALLADVYLTEGGWPINNQSKYALAAQTAKQVIDNKTQYGFDLAPDLATLWSSLQSGTTTSEEVFAIHSCGCDWNHCNAVFGNSSMPAEEGGWGDYFSEIGFYKNFPAGVRKNMTFDTVINGNIPWQADGVKHPYFAKFRVDGGQTVWQTNATLPLMRYAHVLLIYAEAQARSESSPNSQAYSCINAIRARAGLPALSGLSQTDFINATVNERAWEFAGEYTRWFDLVRLQLVPQVNAVRDAGEIPIIGPVKYTLPIPSGDVLLNPNL